MHHDPTGPGIMDTDIKQGWVLADCLLETNVPVALATAESHSQEWIPFWITANLSEYYFGQLALIRKEMRKCIW